MMNRENINTAIGCNVQECKFNCDGRNCTLQKILVGESCAEGQCTCCESFQSRNA